MHAPADGIAEAQTERWWRYRCGEPHLGRYPIRCRRDLNHPSPHIGIGHEPVSWEGVGNAISAQNGDYKCWGGCSAHPERVTH